MSIFDASNVIEDFFKRMVPKSGSDLTSIGNVPSYLAQKQQSDPQLTQDATGAAGNVIKSFLTVIGSGAKYVATPLGGAVSKVNADPAAAIDSLIHGGPITGAGYIANNDHLNNRLNIAQQQALKNASSNTAAFNIAMQDKPIEKFAWQVLFDPWTVLGLVTAGAPEAATGAADASKLAQAGDFARFGLQRLNEGYNTVAGAPIKAGLKGGESLLRATGALDVAPKGEVYDMLGKFLRAVEERQNALQLPGETPPAAQTAAQDIIPKGPTNGATKAADNLLTQNGSTPNKIQQLTQTPAADLTGQIPQAPKPSAQEISHIFADPNGVNVQVPLHQDPAVAHDIVHTLPTLTPDQQNLILDQMRTHVTSLFPPDTPVDQLINDPKLQHDVLFPLLSELRSGERTASVAGSGGLSNYSNGQFTNNVPRFLTLQEVADREGIQLKGPDKYPDLSDPATKQAVTDTLQQFIDTPADDPRWRYTRPGTRTAFGKESLQPSLNRSLISQSWNEGVQKALQDISQTGKVDTSLGIVPPAFRNLAPPAEQWFGVSQEQLPPALNNVADQFTQSYTDAYNYVNELPGMAKFRGNYNKAETTLGLILDKAQQADPTILDDSTNSADVLAKLTNLTDQGHITPEDLSTAEEIVKQWGVPGFQDAKDKYLQNIGQTAHELIQKQLDPQGYNTSQLEKNYQWFMRAYKETKLMTPRNLIQNRLDMAVKTIRELAQTGHTDMIPEVLKNTLTFRNPTSATDLLAPLGENVRGTALISGSALRQGNSVPQEFSVGTHTPFTDKGALLKPLDKLARLRRDFELAQDTSFRTIAYTQGVLKNIEDTALPAFTKEFEGRLADAGMSRAAIDNTMSELLVPHQGLFSSQDVLDAVSKEMPDNQQLANSLALRWQKYTNDSVKAGLDQANKVHFNYGDIRKGDEWLNKVSLFHFWATRNIPYYLNTFAENPFLMRFMLDYVNTSNDERKQLGWTSRTQNKILGFDFPTFLGSTLIGEGATALFDPMVALSIYDQSRTGLSSAQYATTPWQKALSYAQTAGIVPSPIISEFMNVMGANGQQEPQNLFSQSNVLRDVTQNVPVLQNIRPEHWIQQGIVNARAALTGQPAPQYVSDSSYNDYLINKKIRELGYQMTGNVQDPRFEEAMGDPQSPIYQYAKKLVDRQSLLTDIYSLVSPVPMTIVPDTEQTARASQASLPNSSLSDATLQALRQDNNPAALYWSIPQGKKETQIRSAQALIHQVGSIYQKDPTFMAQVYAHFPAYQEYRAWAATQPQDANKTVNAFLGNLATDSDIKNITNTAQSLGFDNQALNLWLTQQGYNSLQDIPHDQVRYVLEALRQAPASSSTFPLTSP